MGQKRRDQGKGQKWAEAAGEIEAQRDCSEEQKRNSYSGVSFRQYHLPGKKPQPTTLKILGDGKERKNVFTVWLDDISDIPSFLSCPLSMQAGSLP